jgi:diacylglycerol kinase (ATP)
MNESDSPEKRPFRIGSRLRSFRHAFRGVFRMIQSQHNAWIHAAATAVVVGAGIFLQLSRGDWCWIVLSISIVWMAEAFNTAMEFLADAVSAEHHPLIRDAKDVAAGAVLITATGAAIIGVVILLPYVEMLVGAGR